MKHWMLEGKLGVNGEYGRREIEHTPLRIGRRPEATLRLPRHTVSGMHAEVYTRDNRLFVRDLGSTNGTFVNGIRITGEAEVHERDMIQFADVTLKVSYSSRKRESRTATHDCLDHAVARVEFERLMAERLVLPHFQPIVDLESREIVAFEILGRSDVAGLETPWLMFAAAADLQQEAQLSDLLRTTAVGVSQQFPVVPHIFLNTHPAEFVGATSWDWVKALRELSPIQPLTIEVHEAAVTDVGSMIRFRTMLKEFNIGLAFDDFGAGRGRITELAEVRPEYLKFDRQLINGLDRADATRQRFVQRLVDAVLDIGVVPLAECIETPGEADVCQQIGFHLAQGYQFGVPGPIDAYSDWENHSGPSNNSVVLRRIAPATTP